MESLVLYDSQAFLCNHLTMPDVLKSL